MLRTAGILLVVIALFPTWNAFLPDVFAPTLPTRVAIVEILNELAPHKTYSEKSVYGGYLGPKYANGPCELPPKGEWLHVTVSWYGNQDHGKPTATGKTFNQNKVSAAHTCLPFGTKVVFYDPDTKRELVIPITDRGPFDPDKVPASREARKMAKNLTPHPKRQFDFSKAAARKLGFVSDGTAELYAWVL